MFSHIISHSPWYYYLLCVLLALLFTFVLYYKNKQVRELPLKITLFLSSLRFISSFIILFLLLNLILKQIKNETEPPFVLFAIDNSSSISASINNPDSLQALVKNLMLLRKGIGEKYKVQPVLFGSASRNTEENPNFTDKETDIQDLFREIETVYSNQNIGALIIASDGIHNKGADPLSLAEKMNFPVYTIALGDTNEFKDIAIQKVNHNQVAYFGNSFPVEVQILAKKFKDQTLNLSILQNGIEKAKEKLKINSENYSALHNFTINAETKGINTYQVKIEILKGEKNISNNSQSFMVEVIDNREKILLLANSPHPDVAALKTSILNNSMYELEYQLMSEFNKNLKAFSLVILHGGKPGSKQVEIITTCKNYGIPYWIINPASLDQLSGVRINGALNKYNDAEVVLNKSFDLFTLSDDFKKFAEQLPALNTFFGNYQVNTNSNSMLFQKIGVIETEQPILVFNETDGLKSADFIGDGLWKWKMRDYSEHENHAIFDELINKSIQYLSVKNDKSMFRITYPKIVYENQAVEIEAEVYNKSYEIINTPEVNLTLSNSKNEKFSYTFNKTDRSYKVNLGLLNPGEYHFVASVKTAEGLSEKKGLLIVKEVVAEKLNTVANHQLLNQLSSRSGGKLYYPNQSDQLLKELLKSEKIKTITYSQSGMLSLIELKTLFWVIIGFLSIEWFFRKRYLSI